MMSFAIVARAENILGNGDFETLNPETGFLMDWGIHYIWSGPCEIVNDFGKAHGGSVALHINQKAPKAHKDFVTFGSARRTSKPGLNYRLSIWAKGEGAVSMTVYFSAEGEYLSSDGSFPPNKPLQSEFFPVKSDDWKQYCFNFTVPDILTSITTKHTKMAPQTVEVLFNSKGDIYLDDAELYLADQIPQEDKPFVFDKEHKTFMTIPRLSTVPEIDGKLNDATWKRASATTGFRAVGGVLSPRQTIVYACYDNDNLYIAFTALQLPGGVNIGESTEFINFHSDVEGFEIWLAADGERWRQLLVVPGGGWLSNSADGDNKWGRQVKYASTTLESTMMFGGIMATDSKTWHGELAIPFSAIGMDFPKDGGELHINFCRDISMEKASTPRTSEEWTSWSGLLDFQDVKNYGRLVFSDSTFAQCKTLENPSNGTISLSGTTGKGSDVQTRVQLPQYNKTLLISHGTADDGGNFAVSDEVRLTGAESTPAILDFSISDKSGKVISQNSVPFLLMPAFGVSQKLFYSAKLLKTAVDFTRLSHGDGTRIALAIMDDRDALVADKTIVVNAKDKNANCDFDFSQWKPGAYTLKAKAFDVAGKTLAHNSISFKIPQKPTWMNTTLWNDRSVPEPFTPIRQNGKETAVVLRTYQWQDSGLPQSVNYNGHALFAAPAELVLKVDNKSEKLQFASLKTLETSKDLVRYAVSGKSVSVELNGTLDVEFDGFARWNVNIAPLKPGVRITELTLVFPVAEKDALFLRGDGYTGSLIQDRYTAAPRQSSLVHVGNMETMWGSWKYDASGWHWTDQYFYEVVICSDKYGFSIMSEDNEYIRGKKYIDVHSDIPGAKALTVSLVSEPTMLDKPLKYDYFFQTLPIRPTPKEAKKWHVALDPSSIFNINLPGYLNTAEGQKLLDALYVGQSYHDLAPQGFATWAKDEQSSKEALAKFHSHGMKIVSNQWYAVIPEICDEYKIFGAEWRAYPDYYWSTPTSMMRSACLNSAFADFHIENIAKIIAETDFDGVYTDATPILCNNVDHGCGWTDPEGKRHSDLTLLSTRRFVKQMYRLLKKDGLGKINFNHNGESPATAAFIDVRQDGEELIWEGQEHYRRITPDYFRSTYAQTEYGIPYLFHAVFHYGWRRVGDIVPIREILMMTLPHHVQFALAYDVEILPVWQIIDPWWTSSDFRAYWHSNCPVSTSEPTQVLSSMFIKPNEKRALVIFSNWSYETKAVNWEIDCDKLGFKVNRIADIDTVTTRPSKTGQKLTLKPRDFAIVELQGE
ncbi:MAG: hypothetical protein IJJ33_10015 [Victivallales bacterium]|nr:hypothetical protein [Victivallales bacterium]